MSTVEWIDRASAIMCLDPANMKLIRLGIATKCDTEYIARTDEGWQLDMVIFAAPVSHKIPVAANVDRAFAQYFNHVFSFSRSERPGRCDQQNDCGSTLQKIAQPCTACLPRVAFSALRGQGPLPSCPSYLGFAGDNPRRSGREGLAGRSERAIARGRRLGAQQLRAVETRAKLG